MYAKRGGSRANTRGNFRSASSASTEKKPYSKKRSSPEADDDNEDDAEAAKPVKKAKAESTEPFVPSKIETDDKGDKFVALKANSTRRVTVSEFKGMLLVNIREYYADASGTLKSGAKGIALRVEQYNALMAAAPLLEKILEEKGEKVVRPNYDGEAREEEVEAGNVDEDEDEEE